MTTFSALGTTGGNAVETTEGVPLYIEGGRGKPAGVIGLVCTPESNGGIGVV